MTTFENQFNMRTKRALPRTTFHNFLTLNPRTLEQAIHKAVCAVADETLQPLLPGDLGPCTQTRALLALMTFCYARQIYASTDLSDIARRDEDFERLSGQGFPSPQLIRRFRVDNREAVHRCLVAALHFLVAQKISLGLLTKLSDAQLAEEANRRITMASFLDSVELDGEQVEVPPVELSYLFANRTTRGH